MRALLWCILLFPIFINAQESVSDTTIVQEKKISDTIHSPRKATLFSLVLPGAGQVYNHLEMPKGKKKAFWKVPLIYAGLGATGYFALKNHYTTQTLKKEYTFRIDNGFPNPDLPEYAAYDNQGILTLYQQNQRNRDLMFFAFIAVYALNILDAHVEAHFVNFDVSKDLTLNIRPSLQQLNAPGLALSFNFR